MVDAVRMIHFAYQFDRTGRTDPPFPGDAEQLGLEITATKVSMDETGTKTQSPQGPTAIFDMNFPLIEIRAKLACAALKSGTAIGYISSITTSRS